MTKNKNSSVLVIFGQDLPQKSKKWWQQFDKVLGKKELEQLTDPGSVHEAYQLLDNLSRLSFTDGSPVPKLINYRGYELWWLHYDNLMLKFCLPYTQYRRLLLYLKNFNKIYLYQPSYPGPFQYFLVAHNRECIILGKSKRIFPFPLGILAQVILSFWFLFWLKITRPKGKGNLLLGFPYGKINYNFEDIVDREKAIVGSCGGANEDFEEALGLLPKLDTTPFTRQVLPLKEFSKAWRLQRSGKYLKLILKP